MAWIYRLRPFFFGLSYVGLIFGASMLLAGVAVFSKFLAPSVLAELGTSYFFWGLWVYVPVVFASAFLFAGISYRNFSPGFTPYGEGLALTWAGLLVFAALGLVWPASWFALRKSLFFNS